MKNKKKVGMIRKKINKSSFFRWQTVPLGIWFKHIRNKGDIRTMRVDAVVINSDELQCLIKKLESDFEGDEYETYCQMENHYNVLKDIEKLKEYQPKIGIEIDEDWWYYFSWKDDIKWNILN